MGCSTPRASAAGELHSAPTNGTVPVHRDGSHHRPRPPCTSAPFRGRLPPWDSPPSRSTLTMIPSSRRFSTLPRMTGNRRLSSRPSSTPPRRAPPAAGAWSHAEVMAMVDTCSIVAFASSVASSARRRAWARAWVSNETSLLVSFLIGFGLPNGKLVEPALAVSPPRPPTRSPKSWPPPARPSPPASAAGRSLVHIEEHSVD